jgi:hypothetical protein
MEIGLSVSPIKPWRTVGPFSGHATLTSGLVSYWKLNEESGDRADSVGSNTLTDNNTVASATGMRGNAASFVSANTEYLSGTTPPAFVTGTARTLSCWAKQTGAGITIWGVQDSAGGADRRAAINTAGTDPNKTVAIYGNAGALNATSAGFHSLGDWLFLVYTYDETTHKVYANGNEIISAAAADGGSTTGFFVANSAAGPFDGLIDEIGYWSRVLTAAELTALYNAGDGLFY